MHAYKKGGKAVSECTAGPCLVGPAPVVLLVHNALTAMVGMSS